ACFGYDTIVIIVHPLPIANAGNDQTACAGMPVQLNASGGIEYSWSPSQGLSDVSISNPVAIVSSSTTYIVTVTDVNNCSADDDVHIEITTPLITSISGDTSICKGTSAQLLASGGVSYSWSPSENLNNPQTPDPLATPDSTTLYSVIISDGICYADTLHVKITVSSPFVDAGPDVNLTSEENFSFNVNASPGFYQWTPADGLSCTDCLNPEVSST